MRRVLNETTADNVNRHGGGKIGDFGMGKCRAKTETSNAVWYFLTDFHPCHIFSHTLPSYPSFQQAAARTKRTIEWRVVAVVAAAAMAVD